MLILKSRQPTFPDPAMDRDNIDPAILTKIAGPSLPVFTRFGEHGAPLTKVKFDRLGERFAFSVGAQGKGKWRSSLYVDHPAMIDDKPILKFAEIARTYRGYPKLLNRNSAFGPYLFCIVVLDLGAGANVYSGDLRVTYTEFKPSPWIPLAIGEQGGFPNGIEMVAVLPRGIVGRAKGQNGSASGTFYLFDGHKLHTRTSTFRGTAGSPNDPFPALA